MSVRWNEAKQRWMYEFQWRGHRATGYYKTKADAIQGEKAERAELERDADKAQEYHDSVVLRDVADKYYEQHARFQKAAKDTLHDIGWVVRWLEARRGKGVLITQIIDTDIKPMVADRRGMTVKNTDRLISPAGVNRSCTEVLRKI